MGNVFSIVSTRGDSVTKEIVSESAPMDNTNNLGDGDIENPSPRESTPDDTNNRNELREEALSEFKKQLSVKREQRKEILSRHRSEKEQLKQSLDAEIKAKLELMQQNKILRQLLKDNNIEVPEELSISPEDAGLMNVVTEMQEELEKFKNNNLKLRKDLVESNSSLQRAYTDIADLHAHNTESIKQISALKEVISVSKTLIGLREQQLNELKNKLNEIQKSLADREASMLSTDLRQEYERQLQNIRTLRGLYEERARLAEVTRQGLLRELDEQKALNQIETNKTKELRAKVEELEVQVNKLSEDIENKSDQIRSSKVETQGLKSEMSAVNKLFSQVLLGNKTDHDLDKLVHRLEENHGLLTQMAEKEDGNEASTALPKLLLELISQVDEADEKNNENSESIENSNHPLHTTAEDIVQNLPKVWRVLMELLSHQNIADASVPNEEKVTTCYKSVETKSGPVLVPSVSQTYIRLKDLIIEKLALIKEVNRMKQLNVHLESRLEEQEKRLCLVTTELSKTWHVVGRLRRHHHQLHTHEKILKYELQQKRKLLNELKEELEYCREKWDQAREKNTQSEKDWRKLRAEFTSRKTKSTSLSFNHSAESGYSDERQSDDSSESNDESEYMNEPPVRCKKKSKSSFETILDSSTDFNVAEREDPVSDMIDVADLPLDSQDGEDNPEASISDCCSSETNLKNEKACVETEDEVGDIECETRSEETSPTTNFEHNNTDTEQAVHNIDYPIPEMNLANVPVIDPSEIMRSIQKQNERLALKDKKLQKLEENSAALLNKTKCTMKISNEINESLDLIINRPSSSRETHSSNSQVNFTSGSDTKTEAPLIDAKSITESIRIQNERLKKKDEKLENLEKDCSYVVSNLNTILSTEDTISEKLDKLQSKGHNCLVEVPDAEITEEIGKESDSDNTQTDYKSCNEELEHSPLNEETVEEEEIVSNQCDEDLDKAKALDEAEPSTSSELDHEARFAARDLRLKRLEEQTKSLVSKVNKTTSKGVKIHYKLEELHNIYGSENSRAGTPFDDAEDGGETDSHDDESALE